MTQLTIAFCLLAACIFSVNLAKTALPLTKATIVVQATNNTQVPSVTYIVDAVKCLEEAHGIYPNDTDRAELYAALFEEKHPGRWNVVVGYTAYYINSTTYIETSVSGGDKDKSSSSSAQLYLLFSSD